MKRGGGRRYYRPEDLELLNGIRQLLHRDGYTIKGVQKILREQGVEAVKSRNISLEQTASGSRQQAYQTQTAGAPVASSRRPRQTPTPAKPGANRQQSALPVGSARTVIAAAIGELEACRNLLQGTAMPITREKRTASTRNQ